MSLPLLTAISDSSWEAELVAALDRQDLGVSIARRCVDLPDLLATAATGQGRAVLLSWDLRRLDREALARLALSGVAVVGLAPVGDEAAHVRLRQLGAGAVVTADCGPEAVCATVLEAVASLGEPTAGQAASFAGQARFAEPAEPEPPERLVTERARGSVVAVWGPTGAPGRTTVAIGVAAELAALGGGALLVDADVYGGTVAQALGVLDEAPGLAAAARLANAGTLDPPALAGLARTVSPAFRVLTGLARADRWPELRPSAVEEVLERGRSLAPTTVVDCGFCLELDEELAYDGAAPRRNGVTLAVLALADTVVVVGAADPVGLQRLVRALADLRELRPDVEPVVVVNRLRGKVIPGDPAQEITGALARYAGVTRVRFVPQDVAALDAAVLSGRTLAQAAPGSAARRALQELALSLRAGAAAPARGARAGARRHRFW